MRTLIWDVPWGSLSGLELASSSLQETTAKLSKATMATFNKFLIFMGFRFMRSKSKNRPQLQNLRLTKINNRFNGMFTFTLIFTKINSEI